jgi:ribonuclease HII
MGCMTQKIDPSLIPPTPQLDFERGLWRAGIGLVAGTDEAGRGCLAGPVFAAAVILPSDPASLHFFSGVRDSKTLAASKREELRMLIERHSRAWAVGSSSSEEIDQLGILPATRLAMQRAIDGLEVKPEHLLVDYVVLPEVPIPQTRLVKGDARSLSIAAASILAKTHRDEYMTLADRDYPSYGFNQNKGYGTAAHRQAILDYGPTPLHRFSFAPLKELE